MGVDGIGRGAGGAAARTLGAANNAVMTAIESAPAWATRRALSGVMPPMATTAGRGPSRSSTSFLASVSTDSGARTVSGLTVDANMAPKAM